MAVWSRLQSLIFGGAIGAAARTAIEPQIEPARQLAWSRNQVRLLAVDVLAELVAQGLVGLGDAQAEAQREGFSDNKMQAAAQAKQTAPGTGELLRILRRGKLTPDQFLHGLRKGKLEPQWDGFLADLEHERLSVADLAYAVVRGLVPDAGILPVAPPASGDKVPRFPMFPIDTLAEAAAQGFDKERFSVMVGRSGLSMAPVMAANAFFRNIIGIDDYHLAIAEGDTRNEWADPILNTSRQILTAHDYAELQLRGYLTRDQRLTLTGRHGMSTTDSDLLYDVLGRSIAVHAITTGLARGGTYPGTYTNVPQPYRAAIERSNIREEYAELAYANRYSLPSAFVLRALTKDGDITQTEAETLLKEIGWPPTLAATVSASWAGGTAAGPVADPHVKRAQTTLFTALHKSYVARESGQTDVQPGLTALGIPGPAQTEILSLWSAERDLIHKQLSPAQVHKAVKDGVINPATGVAWTLQDGINALLARGYTQADATVLLNE